MSSRPPTAKQKFDKKVDGALDKLDAVTVAPVRGYLKKQKERFQGALSIEAGKHKVVAPGLSVSQPAPSADNSLTLGCFISSTHADIESRYSARTVDRLCSSTSTERY
jgi:hypothetical protein